MSSTRAAAQPETLAAKVRRDRVALLFNSYPLSIGMTFAVAAMFVWVHASNHPSGFYLPWLAAMCALLLYRSVSVWQYRHQPAGQTPPERWLRSIRIGTGLTAIVWGLGGLLFYDPQHGNMQIFTVLVIAGVSAGALNALSADFVSYRNYVVLAIAPLSLLSLAQGNHMQVAIGLLILLLLVFLLKSGKHTADNIDASLRLRYANQDLLEDLKQQKQHVVAQAEAMISQLVASAPVSLWLTDLDGKVTFVSSNTPDNACTLQHPPIDACLPEVFRNDDRVTEALKLGLAGHNSVFELQHGKTSLEVHLNPLLDEHGQRQGVIGVSIDITEHKHQERELAYRANYDQLTGLANRSLAMEEIQRAFKRAERSGTMAALCFIDLDNFKTINDTMGHKAGDQLLQQTAKRLVSITRGTDFCARISGDEFIVLAEGLDRAELAENVAYKLISCFRPPYSIHGRDVFASASIGVAVYPNDGATPGHLLQNADTAMYHAKETGKSTFCFYTASMQEEADRNHLIETQLRQALQNNEFKLHYQPKVDAITHRIKGAEALLRWHSQTLGPVGPEEFIPVAELAGLMPAIGAWVLRKACEEFASWNGGNVEQLHIAINISPQQFRKTDLLANVTEALVSNDLPAGCLELEITESLLVQDAADIVNTFEALNDLGVQLALDDFGTGYSSLSYLRKFPLQVLKIDKAFVQDLGKNRDSEALVHAIIAMAQSMRMQLVAEGVETKAQLDFLSNNQVDLIQGFYFSRPLDAKEFRQLLIDYSDRPLLPASTQEARPAASSA